MREIYCLKVIPRTLMPREITGVTVGEVRAVSDMHQRKSEMARQADAFIALPGGYGTLEELLEVITWAQLGIHRKPVGLLNVDGYYSSLIRPLMNASFPPLLGESSCLPRWPKIWLESLSQAKSTWVSAKCTCSGIHSQLASLVYDESLPISFSASLQCIPCSSA